MNFMGFIEDVLKYEEKIIFELRSLYKEFGYSLYQMSRFEEYELYAKNKAFLPSGEILTFTGVDGRLMALRPDVTLSIVKYAKDDSELKKLYYDENVYRSDGQEFKEHTQVGLECIGHIDINLMSEVLLLAKRSLNIISDKSRLDISHIGFLSALIKSESTSEQQYKEIISCFKEKNTSELTNIIVRYGFSDEFRKMIATLASLYGSFDEVAETLRKMCINDDMTTAFNELDSLQNALKAQDINDDICIDFSIVNDTSYYNGVIFRGYIEGIPDRVLSGGRYDELMRKFNKQSGAIGFAVYLGAQGAQGDGIINIALPKGRLGEKAYSIFEQAGYECPEIREQSRKLVFENIERGVRYFWVKPSDVASYVERGAADIGVVGKDILLESTPDVYELLDLDIGKCAISVAAEVGSSASTSDKTIRVATKFPNIARRYYQSQGREIDIIKLNGSIELAPLLGLSDVIVDIVETGQTLYENEMEPKEKIVDISTRLIANKSSYKFNYKKIAQLCENITESLK